MIDPDVERRAEEVFVRFLARSSADGAANVATLGRLCAEHPDLAEALRGLFQSWQRITGLMGQSLGQGPGPLPPEADPRVTLGDGGEFEGALFARLGRPTDGSATAARYELRGEVARGGMGVILKVWDPNLRRSLAMKVLRGSESGDGSPSVAQHRPRSLARFLEEAQITGQLEHPGILPVHDLGVDAQGRVYFTMPLVRGRDLKQVIALAHDGREGWTQSKVLRVMIRVCEAVAYAHSRGVIHRDLKPANVMVGRFGETYVMDWGLARVIGRPDGHDLCIPEGGDGVATERGDVRAESPSSPLLTADGTVIGTPAYVSPEQIRGASDELDGRTDVYSLGAMLYELFTARMPFCALGELTPPRQVLAAREDGPPTSVAALAPGTPTDLIAICEKAMAQDPGRRYASALEMAEDIERYLSDRPVRAQEASLAHHVKLAYRRNRLVVNLSAAAVLALGLVLFQAYSERRAAEQRRYDALAAGALVEREADLRPALPATVPAFEAWLGEVDDLLSREPSWRRERERTPAELRGEIDRVLSSMAKLVELRQDVRQSMTEALDSDFEEAWDAAVKAIAEHPLYGGLAMPRLDALVPLGPDPTTGLWEFWNFPSGARPAPRQPGGSIRPRSEDGVVLALVPGGRHGEVDLDPFLVGKFEVTQAQWLRVMRENPALYRAGLVEDEATSPLHPGYLITDLHPVEHASWYDAMEFAARTGTELIDEVQWFYACRAGTSTRWVWGDGPEDVAGKVNIADASASAFGVKTADWDDGHALHAPVGSFPANAFGLHDMDGNVSEWVGDTVVKGDWIGDGVRRQYCGAAFMDRVDQATVARFGIEKPETRNLRSGVRVGLTLPRR